MNDNNSKKNLIGEVDDISETSTKKSAQHDSGTSTHLYILVHGLLGSHKHMHCVRDELLENDPNATVFIPCKNGFFKTYDGIDVVGDRVIEEIQLFLLTKSNILANGKSKFTHVSFISYSMGGLVARYCIGELYTYLTKDLGLRLMVFATLATPHLGVKFYKSHLPFPVLTFLGSSILGRSGRQLFLKDKPKKGSEKLLLKLASGKYLFALSKFKHRTACANIIKDYTVAFYTAFITDKNYVCDPQTFETDFSDLKGFPERLVDVTKKPEENDKSSDDFVIRYLKKLGFIFVWLLLLMTVFPVVLTVHTCGTLYSYFRVWKYFRSSSSSSSKEMDEDWEVVENSDPTVDALLPPASSTRLDQFIEKYSDNNEKYAHSTKQLPFDKKSKIMYKNLDSLTWIRLPYSLTGFNTHMSISARNGIARLSQKDSDALKFNVKLITYLAESD